MKLFRRNKKKKEWKFEIKDELSYLKSIIEEIGLQNPELLGKQLTLLVSPKEFKTYKTSYERITSMRICNFLIDMKKEFIIPGTCITLKSKERLKKDDFILYDEKNDMIFLNKPNKQNYDKQKSIYSNI